jgi:hypothetical protein
VDCLDIHAIDLINFSGALKATSNRGLQPAMDHILEHENDPVPELSSISESSASRPTDALDVDEDDEAMAARLAAEGAEAQVRNLLLD